MVPWVPSKIGPRGPPIAPTDRRTPEDRNGQKWPYIIQSGKSPRTPKRPKRGWNQILSRFIIEEASAQDHHRGLFEAISKDNGDKTP
ncbi:hypothetical protein O181_107262 [Austropuccinia psidii MF-1]|uniref:Uncharacterized protein n=1 Tax=Austropuccinia psidii MF-1 TaxID=1389203 RepID=A0A9Q3PP68_9BASI|nr:hypothetical protein [Austropuccinia psidii MF-1]